MLFFEKVKEKVEEFHKTLRQISINTKITNEKIDNLDLGEGEKVQIFDELIVMKEQFQDLIDEFKAMGTIMTSFVSLQSKMIEKMTKYYDLESKALEMSMATEPEKPTEHDEIF